MFKCVITFFLSASTIHLILSYIATHSMIQKFTLPDPDSLHFHLIVDTILEQDWSNMVLHHNLRSAANSAIDCALFNFFVRKGW